MIRTGALLLAALLISAGSATAAPLRLNFNGPRGALPPWPLGIQPCNLNQANLNGPCVDNSRLDGQGHLAIRSKPGFGGMLGSFIYGTGWPAQTVFQSWQVPFTVKVRFRAPRAPGYWTGVWVHSIDSASQIWELDWPEIRTCAPSEIGAAWHQWRPGVVSAGGLGRVDSSRWHSYSLRTSPKATTWKIDGRQVWRGPGIAGRLGLLIDNFTAKAGSWAACGGPAPTAGGTALIDYLEVSP